MFAFLAVIVLVLALWAYTAKNYPEQNHPYFSGNYAVERPKQIKTLTVVSYNIGFAKHIDQALVELGEIQSQTGLDILLLQEMDETGAEQIARELQLNYVYFPAAIEPTYHKNFGNAVLSQWPIVDAQKRILPHKSFSNRMSRIATRATVRVQGTDILVYSIHTESVFTLPQFREDQYTAVLKDVDPDARLVIVGGDFNSFTTIAVEELEQAYRKSGFVRASEASGYSVVKLGAKISTDHIFAKDFLVEDAGKLAGATASDHLPIWVTLSRFNK